MSGRLAVRTALAAAVCWGLLAICLSLAHGQVSSGPEATPASGSATGNSEVRMDAALGADRLARWERNITADSRSRLRRRYPELVILNCQVGGYARSCAQLSGWMDEMPSFFASMNPHHLKKGDAGFPALDAFARGNVERSTRLAGTA